MTFSLNPQKKKSFEILIGLYLKQYKQQRTLTLNLKKKKNMLNAKYSFSANENLD